MRIEGRLEAGKRFALKVAVCSSMPLLMLQAQRALCRLDSKGLCAG